MTYVSINQQCPPRIQVARWVRNGRIVDARFATELAQDSNHAAYYGTKQVFRAFGACSSLVGGAFGIKTRVTDKRWRHAWHSAPQAHYLFVNMVTQADAVVGHSQYVVKLLNGASVATADVQQEKKQGGVLFAPSEWTSHNVLLGPIAGDTDYEAYFQENGSSLVSAMVYEVSLLPDTTNGYSQQPFSAQGPIYYQHRETVEVLSNSQWDRGAAGAFNYFADTDTLAGVATVGLGTFNVLDGSTSVSANSPGYTLDMSNRASLARVTVGMKGWVYGARAIGATANLQHFILKNSAGANVVDVTGFGTTPSWLPFTFDLPASRAKYDPYALTTNGNFTLYAASVQEMT